MCQTEKYIAPRRGGEVAILCFRTSPYSTTSGQFYKFNFELANKEEGIHIIFQIKFCYIDRGSYKLENMYVGRTFQLRKYPRLPFAGILRTQFPCWKYKESSWVWSYRDTGTARLLERRKGIYFLLCWALRLPDSLRFSKIFPRNCKAK